jgi:hypothetical protein
MTNFKKLTSLAAASSLAITMFGAISTAEAGKEVFQRTKPHVNVVRSAPRVGSKSLKTGAQGQAAGDNGTFCGNADVFVFYEEDANGKPVPGTKEYGCTD